MSRSIRAERTLLRVEKRLKIGTLRLKPRYWLKLFLSCFSRQAVASNEDAFRLTQGKYENGKASITEFNEAKNNLLKAQSDMVQAKYESLYQNSLLDFYRGKSLDF